MTQKVNFRLKSVPQKRCCLSSLMRRKLVRSWFFRVIGCHYCLLTIGTSQAYGLVNKMFAFNRSFVTFMQNIKRGKDCVILNVQIPRTRGEGTPSYGLHGDVAASREQLDQSEQEERPPPDFVNPWIPLFGKRLKQKFNKRIFPCCGRLSEPSKSNIWRLLDVWNSMSLREWPISVLSKSYFSSFK